MGEVDDETMNGQEGQCEPAPGTGSRLPATDDPVAAALEYLDATASKVHPDLSPRRLLYYCERNRAHLATVLAAIKSGQARWPASQAPAG